MIKNTKKGFTLIETLVAIAILLLAVTAPLSLANKSLNSASLSKQQIIASFLAQEAMEYIRNVRDENVLKHNGSWLHPDSGIQFCFNGKCTVEPTGTSGTDKIKKCQETGGSCLPLRFDPSNGVYSYSDGGDTEESIYTRFAQMDEIENDEEVAVLVTVSWQGTNGANYEVVARENLTNWQF
ncbi:MAG: prepilin-type N-terminal cleavage/methylation domain-containing protein [Candidatus Paceibacterota bacterium]|jgi:prepilin-type N-terminal cleavage/methylation domain-containing protein